MREALSSLTGRGRILLAAGLTAVACAALLGQSTLMRAGLFSALLPLAAVALMSRSGYRITLHRTVQPRLVASGQSARITLTVANEGSTAPGNVVVEDELGYALGGRPRFQLGRLRRGSRSEHQYRVTTDVRGRHTIGPAHLRVSDPLGLVEVRRRFRTTSTLVVLPAAVPLTGAPVGAARGGGESQGRPGGGGDAQDGTVRPYRRGDDVRRVHWRSSARSNELMVRNDEESPRLVSTVALDLRAHAHRGAGAASSFEAVVRIATAVVTHLHRHGHDLRLVLGARTVEVSAFQPHDLDTALEELAVLTPEESPDGFQLHTVVAEHHLAREDVFLIAGEVTPAENRLLTHVVAPASAQSGAYAFLLDVNAWNVRQHSGLSAQPLGGGWRSTVVTPRSSIADAWNEVNR